jgi:hypothetical protein
MTPGEFKEIARSMKDFDIAYVKMGDVELRRGTVYPVVQESVSIENLPQGITTQPDDPIQHKVDHLTSLMKLSDKDLVDQLFPDKTDVEESA